ncbi:putative ribonuclease T2 [Plasmopara halstedii]
MSSNVSVYDATITTFNPQVFDLYILAQSWQPTFCSGKEAQYPGCRNPETYWETHLTLHGLWPEESNHVPPSFCSREAFDAKLIEHTIGMKTLHEFWPDVKVSETSDEYAEFWKHEWTRHGTCSGLSQVDYFTQAINLERNDTLAPTPEFVQQHVGKEVNVNELRQAFGDAALKCQHSHTHSIMFSQVFTCWQKNAQNIPTHRCVCPPHIHAEDTCGSTTILIPSFSTDD